MLFLCFDHFKGVESQWAEPQGSKRMGFNKDFLAVAFRHWQQSKEYENEFLGEESSPEEPKKDPEENAEEQEEEFQEFKKALEVVVNAKPSEAYLTVQGSVLPKANGLYIREPDANPPLRYIKYNGDELGSGEKFGDCFRKIGSKRTLFPDREGNWCLGSEYEYNDLSGGSTGNMEDQMEKFPWNATFEDHPNLTILEATFETVIEKLRENRENLNRQILQLEERCARIRKDNPGIG